MSTRVIWFKVRHYSTPAQGTVAPDRSLNLELVPITIRSNKSSHHSAINRKMDIRSFWSTLALVLGTNNPQKILNSMKNVEFFAAARGESSRLDDPVDPFNQPDCTSKERNTTEVRGAYLTWSVIRSLLAIELRNLDVILSKEAMQQELGKWLQPLSTWVSMPQTRALNRRTFTYRGGINRYGTSWVNRWNLPEGCWTLASVLKICKWISWESVQLSESYQTVDRDYQPHHAQSSCDRV